MKEASSSSGRIPSDDEEEVFIATINETVLPVLFFFSQYRPSLLVTLETQALLEDLAMVCPMALT